MHLYVQSSNVPSGISLVSWIASKNSEKSKIRFKKWSPQQKPRVTDLGCWCPPLMMSSHSEYEWSVSVRVNHRLFPIGSQSGSRFEGEKEENKQADKRWIAARFHRTTWRDRTVAQSWDAGNCNGMHLREMNINYTWRMINELQSVSYSPRRGSAGHWWLFTKDYNPIYCSSPKAKKKPKVIS